MPYTITLTKNGKCLFKVGSGVLTSDEIMDAENVLLTTEDKVRDITFSLVDLSDVTRFEVTSDEIHRIADVAKRIALLAPHIVVAVIAPGDYVFGLARMWETLVESTGWTTAVVRSKAEADAWVKTKLVTQCEE